MKISERLYKLSDAADQDVKAFACNDVAQSAAETRRAIYVAAALLAELLEQGSLRVRGEAWDEHENEN